MQQKEKMNNQVTILKKMDYVHERKGFYEIGGFGDSRFINEIGRKIIDSINKGYDLQQICNCLDYTDKANNIKLDVYEFLLSLQEAGYINFEDEYFADVLVKTEVLVAGESEYKEISKCLIHALRENSIVFAKIKDPKYYNVMALRQRNFNNHENYFYEMKDGIITNIIGINDVYLMNQPVNIILTYTAESIDSLAVFYKKCEEYLKKLGKFKVKVVMNETPCENPVSEFLNRATFKYEAKLEKENGVNDDIIYSRIFIN
jgi:hypothetical protein